MNEVGWLGSCPGCQPIRVIRYYWKIRNMVLKNSIVYTHKNFSENYLQLGHASSKRFNSLVGGRKSSGCRGCKIIGLPGVPMFLGLALHAVRKGSD